MPCARSFHGRRRSHDRRPKKMSCAEFQAQLPELIGSGENAADHPHIRTASCAAPCWPTLRPLPRLRASCSPSWNRQTTCGRRSSRRSKRKRRFPEASPPDSSRGRKAVQTPSHREIGLPGRRASPHIPRALADTPFGVMCIQIISRLGRLADSCAACAGMNEPGIGVQPGMGTPSPELHGWN
jgi:hypothetical protein